MSRRVELTLHVDIAAPVEAVWDAVVDWPAQGDWMLLTTVRATAQGGVGVGGGIEAVTGVGRLGAVDTMTITEWDPPRRCVVEHTGRVVRGDGVFTVEPLADGRSRFVWTERLDLPLGLLGRAGWPVVRPLFAAGVRASLRKLGRRLEAQQAARPAQPGGAATAT